jgi:hypothetical protein
LRIADCGLRIRREACNPPSAIRNPQSAMVFAVQCPNPKCRKFMLVEERDRNRVVPCLLCKTPIRVGAPTGLGKSPRPTPPQQP